MASTWFPLPLSGSSAHGLPLLSFTLGDESYDIHITDLVHIWAESLSKKDIVERAKASESSIDPSQNESQMDILLQKLKDALQGSESTSLKISSLEDADAVTIQATSPLPRPLRPFTWSFHLSRQPDQAVRSDIIIPVLGKCFVQRRQIDELKRFLAEKDILINKMLDKVESLGLEATAVFPNVAIASLGKKVNKRDQLAQHVRGLAVFDEQQWKQSSSALPKESLQISELINAAFEQDEILFLRQQWAMENASTIIQGGPHGSIETGRPSRLKHERNSMAESSGESQQDDFQRQNTPPARVRADKGQSYQAESSQVANNMAGIPKDEESTEDEDDLDAPYVEAKHRKPEPGGSHDLRAAEASPISLRSPEVGHATRNKLGTVGKLESTATSDDAKAISEPVSSREAWPESRTSRPKLGSIGKHTTATTDKQSTENARISNEESSNMDVEPFKPNSPKEGAGSTGMPLPRPARRLGKIGGAKSQVNTADNSNALEKVHAQSSGSPQSSTAGEESPRAEHSTVNTVPHNEVEAAKDEEQAQRERSKPAEPEETAEEKADRKREELKRQLGDRAKSQSKKKRRF